MENLENYKSKCLDCKHKDKIGIWRGMVELIGNKEVYIEGKANLINDTFEIDNILEEYNIDIEQIEGFDGEAYCPNCGSRNYY